MRREGTHDDDATATRLSHGGSRRAKCPKCSEKVGVELRPRLFQVELLDTAKNPEAGVAYDRIQRFRPVRDLGEASAHGFLAADIHRDPVDGGCARAHRVGVATGSEDLEAPTKQAFGGSCADAG